MVVTRKLMLPLLAVLAGAPIAAGATAHPVSGGRPVVVRAAGEIKALGLSRISVGRVTCSFRPGAASVSRFVVGDPVSIGCKAGVLQAIKYAPPASAARDAAPNPTPVVTKPPAGSTLAPPQVSQGDPSGLHATGTITSITNGITIGDTTCPITIPAGTAMSQVVRVGVTASISCSTTDSGLRLAQVSIGSSQTFLHLTSDTDGSSQS